MVKVAVVTGGNKGIGFEVCRQLAGEGFKVVLTARDPLRGKEASRKLQGEGLDVTFHLLDVTKSEDSVKLATFLRKEFSGVDVLVNNAAVYLDSGTNILELNLELVKKIMETNLLGPFLVSQAVMSLMPKGGRVINVSSNSGQVSGRLGLVTKARAPFYGISKLALNGLTIKLAGNNQGVRVNSVSPGWVRTDMGGRFATRSVKKGAETIVWLATAKKIPNGKFLKDKKIISW